MKTTPQIITGLVALIAIGCTPASNTTKSALTAYDKQVLETAKNNNFGPNTFILEKSLFSEYCPAQETYYHLQSELGPGMIKTARLCCGENYCRGTTTGNYYD